MPHRNGVSVRSFADVALLPPAAWSDLVRTGLPVERVYAAWCIASRGTEPQQSAIRDAAMVEPSPGVRRHFAVILAGRGDLDALLVLARHDPDSLVRAGAARLLTQIAVDRRELWPLVVERLSDVSEVRLAIATSVDARTPSDVLRRVASLIDDEELDVRKTAFNLLDLEGSRAVELEAVLARRCVVEVDDALRRRCQERMLRGAMDVVFEQAADAPAERIDELLKVAKALGVAVGERSAARWLERDDVEVAHVVALDFTGRDAELSFSTFARLFPHWTWRYRSTALLGQLVGRLDEVPWSRWPRGTQAAIAELCQELRTTIEYLDADPASRDRGDDEYFDDRWCYDDGEWRAAAKLVLDRFGNARTDR